MRKRVLGGDVNGAECLTSIAEDRKTDYRAMRCLPGLRGKPEVRSRICVIHPFFRVQSFARKQSGRACIDRRGHTVLDDCLLEWVTNGPDGFRIPKSRILEN